MYKAYKKIVFLGLVLLPGIVYAQPNTLGQVLTALNNLVKKLIPVAFGFAVVVFFWGLAKYMLNTGSEESKIEGRRIMTGGVIALFIMASIWGIISFVSKDIGLPQVNTMKVPLIGL